MPRLSKTCCKVCDELGGDCKTNAFKTSAGYWNRRIPSSWALPSRRGKKNPQKSLKLCEASELKEKSEGGYADSLNDLQGKISFSKRFTGQEHIFLLLLSSGSPLSPRCLSGWGDHCPTGWESGLFGDRGGLAITRL